MQPDGKMIPVEKFDFKGHEMLEKFAKDEIAKVRGGQQVPADVA